MNRLPMNPKLLFAAIAVLIAVPATCQDIVAVKAKKILTITGPTIDDGVLLIENGRIQKIAKQSDVEIPWSAKVIDASDKIVMPTWVIAHSQGGQRTANENMQNVPWLTVADSIDPSSTYFEDMLRNGVGTIHVLPGNQTLLGGMGMVVRPYGRTVEDMAVAGNTGIKLSLLAGGGGRLQQIRKLRRALEDARDYLSDFERRKAEFDKEKAAGAIPADKTWTEEIDRQKKSVVDLIEKKTKGWLFVPSYAEVDEALRLSQELDLQWLLGPNIDEAIAQIVKFGKPVVLDENIEYFKTDDETKKEKKYCSAKLLNDAGVPFALTLGAAGPTSYAWWQIGTCVRNGVDAQKALEALTIVPARMLGLGDQVGSLAEGKLANLQILTDDPMQATAWVDTVLLEGEVVYERKTDPRLQYLFAEDKKSPAKAEGPAKASEPKPEEPKPAESKSGEPKSGEPKSGEPKPVPGGGNGGAHESGGGR